MPYRNVKFIGLFVFVFLHMLVVYSDAAVVRERTSNPTAVSGQADGLAPGGDRHNSYAWAMGTLSQPDGDYLYVGSNRDLIYNILRGFFIYNTDLEPEQFNPLITTLLQGDIAIPDDPPDNQGRVFRYKLDGTKPWEEVWRGNYAYRGAVNFTDSSGETALYMVTTQNPGRVLKFTENFQPGDTPVEVFRVTATSGLGVLEGPLRGMTIHNNELYISTFNNRIYKTALPQQQTALIPGNTATYNATVGWTRIDGDAIPTGDGAIWQILSFNNYLYAFIAGTGFRVYKGSPGVANGWTWQKIVGDGAPYPAGMGDPYNNSTATRVFKGHVYVGSMSEVHLSFMTGTFSLDKIKGGQIYRFDANDRWELIIGDLDRHPAGVFDRRIGNYGAGFFNLSARQRLLLTGTPFQDANLSFNQYIWWLEEHRGKLYATTFDISIFLKYITAENMEYLGMEADDIKTITDALAMLELIKENPAGFDLYSSSDGVNWSPVTIDGFGDPYNYGGRTMKSTDQGLFIGTANPFYGCQVWRLDETGGGDAGGGGCFIATAAFGSPLAGQVEILRQFRDRYLMTNAAGRTFVSWYYRNGKMAAQFIADKPMVRAAVRAVLYPVIGFSFLLLSGYLPFVILGFLLSALVILRLKERKLSIV